MKAKDLTPADVGKWVTFWAQITHAHPQFYNRFVIEIPGGTFSYLLPPDTILEFTDPPAPVQEVGDVFKYRNQNAEFTLSAIVDDYCLMIERTSCGKNNGAAGMKYPLDSRVWTFVRKGNQS